MSHCRKRFGGIAVSHSSVAISSDQVLQYDCPMKCRRITVDQGLAVLLSNRVDFFPGSVADTGSARQNYFNWPTTKIVVWHGLDRHKEYGEVYVDSEEWNRFVSSQDVFNKRVVKCNKDDHEKGLF